MVGINRKTVRLKNELFCKWLETDIEIEQESVVLLIFRQA
jgi:hypothetical protein